MAPRRRRRRARGSNRGDAARGGDTPRERDASRERDGGDGRSRDRRRSRSGGRGADRARQKPKDEGIVFWGDPEKLPEPRPDVRITEDPAAVPRSLGTPPLPGQEKVAEHYFAAVYDRAVGVAGALAAAGGLIDPTALAGDEDDHDD